MNGVGVAELADFMIVGVEYFLYRQGQEVIGPEVLVLFGFPMVIREKKRERDI